MHINKEESKKAINNIFPPAHYGYSRHEAIGNSSSKMSQGGNSVTSPAKFEEEYN